MAEFHNLKNSLSHQILQMEDSRSFLFSPQNEREDREIAVNFYPSLGKSSCLIQKINKNGIGTFMLDDASTIF